MAATTLVGQSLGAGELKKAQRYASIVHHMAIAVACLMGLVFLLFSHPLARLYTDDLEVAALAGTVLKILALAQPGQSTQLTLAGALRGAGDTMYPLYASIFGIWIFRVAVAFVFVNVLGWGLIGRGRRGARPVHACAHRAAQVPLGRGRSPGAGTVRRHGAGG